MPGRMRVTVGDRYEQWAVGRARQYSVSCGELILSHQSQVCVHLPTCCLAFIFSCLADCECCNISLPLTKFFFLTKQTTIPWGSEIYGCFFCYIRMHIAICSTVLNERMSSDMFCLSEHIKVTVLSHIFPFFCFPSVFLFFVVLVIGSGSLV